MKIIQIVNDFSKTKVHSNMIRNLDELGVNQIVFNAVRRADLIGKNAFEAHNTEFLYANVVKPYHKYFYHIKLNHVFREMVKRIDVKSVDLCHASTLFTDGALAYKLHKKYGIPYFVAIRNTDVNDFMRKAPHTWLMGIKILLNAEKIVFISEGLRRLFSAHPMVKCIKKKIEKKYILLPNGIDDYFLNNVDRTERTGKRVVYVGNFSANKNVVRLTNAVLKLQKQPGFEDLRFTIVGGNSLHDDTLPNLIKNNPDIIDYKGLIFDKAELCKIFRTCKMFAMTSIFETFGLVYIEALSQNLPVLYTKNQGIDGLFGPEVGEAVNPLSEDEIVEGLKKILTGTGYTNHNIDFEVFRWSRIAAKYKELYKATLGYKDVDQNFLKGYLTPEQRG